MNYKDHLQNKLTRLFPEKERRELVGRILEDYGSESHDSEPSRVRLAILKLGGTDIEEIVKETRQAKIDYRDILSWAEYPRQSKQPPLKDSEQKKLLVEADRQEYEAWLNT